MSRFEHFLAELQRRRVYRVAVAYAVVGLGVLEGADVLVPALGLPSRLVTAVAVLSLAGFPVALYLAWRYQLTRDGLQSSESSPPESGPEGRTGRILPLIAAGAAIAFVAFAGGWLLRPTPLSVPGGDGVPIAVLPFTNLSGPDDAYFTDGLHEEIITRLSSSPSFRVTSRTSVMAYRSEPKPIPVVSAELGVDAVLEGSVRRAGNTLRMTAQLIDAGEDAHLWSATYDREYSIEAILAIQEDVAREVSTALRVALAEDAPRPAAPTENLEAYELYLLGRTHWNARSADDLRRAIELFELAIGQDSGFARAWAGLADAYAVLPAYDANASARDAMPRAREAATRALDLDPNLAEAHASLGFVAFTFDWNPDGALEQFARAVELNPSHPPALYWQGWLLGLLGRMEQARPFLERALAVSPRSVGALFSVGSAYMPHCRGRSSWTRTSHPPGGTWETPNTSRTTGKPRYGRGAGSAKPRAGRRGSWWRWSAFRLTPPPLGPLFAQPFPSRKWPPRRSLSPSACTPWPPTPPPSFPWSLGSTKLASRGWPDSTSSRTCGRSSCTPTCGTSPRSSRAGSASPWIERRRFLWVQLFQQGRAVVEEMVEEGKLVVVPASPLPHP